MIKNGKAKAITKVMRKWWFEGEIPQKQNAVSILAIENAAMPELKIQIPVKIGIFKIYLIRNYHVQGKAHIEFTGVCIKIGWKNFLSFFILSLYMPALEFTCTC